MADKMYTIAKNYITRRLKCAEFAVTNVCVAQCTFCGIWKQKPKVFADTEKSLRAIDRLAEFGVSHLTLTGGEPLMHPDIIRLAERAVQRKMHTCVLNAAPQLFMRKDMIKRLVDVGTDMVSISFDSGDPKVMAESRGIENIMDQMREAMGLIRSARLKTMASVLIWNDNCDTLEDVCQRAVDMGFDFISFNYPTFSESDVYELGGCGINMPREKVVEGLQSAIKLKKSGKYPIINSVASMDNIIRYIKDPATVKFPCFGGRRVLFVDWFLNVHPCMQLPDILGNILDMDEKSLHIPPCNRCNMSWYRDFSALFCGPRSLPVMISMLKDSSGII